MKVNVSSGVINNCCFLAEIEIHNLFVALYQYSRRKYYIVIEDGSIYEFNSRKAVDKFISEF